MFRGGWLHVTSWSLAGGGCHPLGPAATVATLLGWSGCLVGGAGICILSYHPCFLSFKQCITELCRPRPPGRTPRRRAQDVMRFRPPFDLGGGWSLERGGGGRPRRGVGRR